MKKKRNTQKQNKHDQGGARTNERCVYVDYRPAEAGKKHFTYKYSSKHIKEKQKKQKKNKGRRNGSATHTV
jgi:hypothetical protein